MCDKEMQKTILKEEIEQFYHQLLSELHLKMAVFGQVVGVFGQAISTAKQFELLKGD